MFNLYLADVVAVLLVSPSLKLELLNNDSADDLEVVRNSVGSDPL